LCGQKNGERVYQQIVENQQLDGKVRQRVPGNLGRLDVLQETDRLDALMVSKQRFWDNLGVISAYSRNEVSTSSSRKIWPARPRCHKAGRQIAARQ